MTIQNISIDRPESGLHSSFIVGVKQAFLNSSLIYFFIIYFFHELLNINFESKSTLKYL